MTNDFAYKHSGMTEAIMGVFYDVYNELGFGFLESVYRNSLYLALVEKGLVVEREVCVSVFFHGSNVGDFRADFGRERHYSIGTQDRGSHHCRT